MWKFFRFKGAFLAVVAALGGAQWSMDRRLKEAWWIWTQKDMLMAPDKRMPHVFFKTVDLRAKVEQAKLRISAQGTYRLWINGQEVGTDDDVITLDQYDIAPSPATRAT